MVNDMNAMGWGQMGRHGKVGAKKKKKQPWNTPDTGSFGFIIPSNPPNPLMLEENRDLGKKRKLDLQFVIEQGKDSDLLSTKGCSLSLFTTVGGLIP